MTGGNRKLLAPGQREVWLRPPKRQYSDGYVWGGFLNHCRFQALIQVTVFLMKGKAMVGGFPSLEPIILSHIHIDEAW